MSSIVDVSIENVDNECFRPVLPLLWTPPASGAICIPQEAPTNFLQSANIPVVKPSVPTLNPINVYLALQKQCSEKSSRRKVLADHSLSIEIGKCFWWECGWRFTEFKSAFVWRHCCFTWWGLMYWNVRRRTLRKTQIFVCHKCGWLFGVVKQWRIESPAGLLFCVFMVLKNGGKKFCCISRERALNYLPGATLFVRSRQFLI